MTVFWPVVFLFIQLKKVAKHISPIKEEETPTVTEQELKFIVESIEDEGVRGKNQEASWYSTLWSLMKNCSGGSHAPGRYDHPGYRG